LVLVAPTGTGKSLLSLVTQRALTVRTHTVVSTLRLQDQMRTSYKHAPVLKGRDNYDCLIVDGVSVSQAPCQVGFKCAVKWSCPYFVDRDSAYKSDYAVFNYQLFMNLVAYSAQNFESPDILFCDEAHLAAGELEKFMTGTLSERDMITQGWQRPMDLTIHGMAKWAERFIPDIEDELEHLIKQIYAITGGSSGAAIKGSAKDYQRAMGKYNRYGYLERALYRFTQAGIDTENGKPWVFDKLGGVYQVRPTDVSDYTENLFNDVPKIVLMSATLNEDDIKRLGLTDYKLVSVGSNYPKERRPIYYRPVGAISAKNENRLFDDIMDEVDTIVEAHVKAGHKGIIHTVSYDRAERIYNASHNKKHMLLHSSDDKDKIIAQYKDSTTPVVLLSPSITEGEDFPDGECRFVIIPKVPYASLGDKLVRERLNSDPSWYTWKACQDIIQGAGRGMRSERDFCSIYILDSNFEKLLEQHGKDIPNWFSEAITPLDE
jgi:ATP-dependent DNA helicase DinG